MAEEPRQEGIDAEEPRQEGNEERPELANIFREDDAANEEDEEDSGVNTCLTWAKLALSILVGLILLACLVSAKVSLIIIAQSLAEARSAIKHGPLENVTTVPDNVTPTAQAEGRAASVGPAVLSTSSPQNYTGNVTGEPTTPTLAPVPTLIPTNASTEESPTLTTGLFSLSPAHSLVPSSAPISKSTTPMPPQDHFVVSAETAVVVLTIIMMVPYALTFIRCAWRGRWGKNTPWPTWKRLSLGLFAATLEVIGLTLFTVHVMSIGRRSLSIVLMNSIFLIPALVQIMNDGWKLWQTEGRKPWKHFKHLPLNIIATLTSLVLLGLLAHWEFYEESPWTGLGLAAAMSLVCLSVGWLPPLQKIQAQVPDDKMKGNTGPGVSQVQHGSKDQGRWRCGIITNLWKMVLTFAMVNLWCYKLGIADPTKLWTHKTFSSITKDNKVWNALIVNLTTGFGANLVAWMACAMKMDKISFVIPLVVAAPVVTALYTYIPVLCLFPMFGWYEAERLGDLSTVEKMCEGTNSMDTRFGLGLAASISWYIVMLITTARHLFKSTTNIMENEERLFWLPGYNNIFPDQWLMLSRRNKDTSPELFKRTTRSMKNTRVYICTTMYRENEKEMEQLLMSIRSIAKVEKSDDQRQFESHIFFDGGCQKGQPTEFALQLLALADKTMGEKSGTEKFLKKAKWWVTPYGLQLEWHLNLSARQETRFCIHLKDNSKVRNKKRWSQVMYMSYVVSYLVLYSPLGMESGAINDDNISASSNHDSAREARLNGSNCWKPDSEDTLPYAEVNLGEKTMVTGMVTQGNPRAKEWVKKYKIKYREVTSSEWKCYKDEKGREEFDGNSDNKTAVTQLFDKPITAHLIRIEPTDFQDCAALRVEILGYIDTDKYRDSYILCTDADVKFSPESANALIDVIASDPTVGGVCGRTHPIGSAGPVVWYQKFDYAISHWFQKTANDTLGSVLCCPGCFSVYCAKAVNDVVNPYASKVEKPEEFLTKDMGEDRWFCTLMVERGWLLRYTAVADDSTYCPEEFDEFCKQRRRWTPSTIANQMLLIRMSMKGKLENQNVSKMFIIYQMLLLFSSGIGASTCILIVAGGLEFVLGIHSLVPLFIQLAICLMYTWCCLNMPQSTQLRVAKGLIFGFTLVMVVVAIGTIKEFVFFFVSNSSSADVTQERIIACTGRDHVPLQCPSDRILNIIHATYGRADPFTCNDVSPVWDEVHCPQYYKEAYPDSTTLSTVRSKDLPFSDNMGFNCQGKQHCNLIAAGECFPATVPLNTWWERWKAEHPEFNPSGGNRNISALPVPKCSSVYLEVYYSCGEPIAFDITIVIFLCITGMFIVATLFHFKEWACSLCGICYLLGLPGGNMILNIYSICNLTDRSWGTREGKTQEADGGGIGNWFINLISKIRGLCTRKGADDEEEIEDAGPKHGSTEDKKGKEVAPPTVDVDERKAEGPTADALKTKPKELLKSGDSDTDSDKPEDGQMSEVRVKSWLTDGAAGQESPRAVRRLKLQKKEYHQSQLSLVTDVGDTVPVPDWLQRSGLPKKKLDKIEESFTTHGYDDISFISGMTKEDLVEIGIEDVPDRMKLMAKINKLPEYAARHKVPDNTEEWLESIGLSQYEQNFKDEGIETKWDLANLKSMKETLDLGKYGITKKAHVKRITHSLKNMRNPSKRDAAIAKVRGIVEKMPTTPHMKDEPSREKEASFWKKLREEILDPERTTFDEEEGLKKGLVDLRNRWLMFFACINTIWLVLITVLTAQADLAILGSNPIGLAVAFGYGIMQGIQFLAMLFHRGIALMHATARVPYPKLSQPGGDTREEQTGQEISNQGNIQNDVESGNSTLLSCFQGLCTGEGEPAGSPPDQPHTPLISPKDTGKSQVEEEAGDQGNDGNECIDSASSGGGPNPGYKDLDH